MKKITYFNAAVSSIQVIITGLVLFFTYKFLLRELGADLLGVWSLIMATSSIANLANFGLTSGLVKFVAEYHALGRDNQLYNLIFTSIVSMVLFLLIAIIGVYWGAHFFLGYFIDNRFLFVALNVLPFSLICLFLNTLGGVFTSVLEGFQKNYLRHFIYIFGLIFFAIFTYILTPKYQILGVVYAQIIQSCLILVLAAFIVIKLYKIYPSSLRYLWGWNRLMFRNLMSYGTKFQLVSLSQMFIDPTTKMLLSKYGGIQLVAYYEMANRLISQIRSLIISANQVIIPVIAEASVKEKERIRLIYIKTFRLILSIEVPLVSLLIIFIPLISFIWIGYLENNFMFFLYILSFCTIILTLNGPAYFGILGEGKLNMMTITYTLSAIFNILFAYLFILFTERFGAFLGNVMTSILATIIMSYMYQRRHNIKLRDLFTRQEYIIFLVGVIICIVSIILNFYVLKSIYISLGINLLIYIILLGPIIYKIGKPYYIMIFYQKREL